MFNINQFKFLLQIIPRAWKRSVFVALLDVLQGQIKVVYDSFKIFRAATIYQLNHNGQVFSLENVLNNRFDNTNRTIYITDGFTKDRFYIYTRAEDKPQYLPKFVWNRADYADTGTDFIVWVPTAVVISLEDMYEMRALINKYKLDPKRYKIYRV